MASKAKTSGVIAAGLALFSMFFGAGDLIWPLILGGETGDKQVFALFGLLLTGVTLPLLGLTAIMLFRGDYFAFFYQIGRVPGIILIFIVQAILGPIGSIPRLITLSHATLGPYLPEMVTLPVFSVLACILVFFFTIKRQQVVDLLGLYLCPVLLLALGSIVVIGFINPPTPEMMTALSHRESFFRGLNVGYNTLDLIASFIFAPLVISYFVFDRTEADEAWAKKQVFKKMLKASCLAAFLLAAMYFGLTFLASYYTPVLSPHAPEARLAAISMHLLGPYGAIFSCIAVSLSCLTTAIPIAVISANYIQSEFMRGKGKPYVPVLVTLGISALIANLGFMGIANMLSPLLQIVCPGLIILCLFSILHILYEMRIRRTPIFAAFAISLIGYFAH